MATVPWHPVLNMECVPSLWVWTRYSCHRTVTPSPVGCLQGVGGHRFRLALPLLAEPSLTDILLSPRVNTCLRMSLAPMGFGTGADPRGCRHFPLSPTVTARRCLAGCLAPGLRASARGETPRGGRPRLLLLPPRAVDLLSAGPGQGSGEQRPAWATDEG